MIQSNNNRAYGNYLRMIPIPTASTRSLCRWEEGSRIELNPRLGCIYFHYATALIIIDKYQKIYFFICRSLE